MSEASELRRRWRDRREGEVALGEKGSTLIIRGVGGGGGGAGGRTGAGAGGGGGGGGSAIFPLSLSFRSLCLLVSSAAIYVASNSRPSSLGADLWFE